MGLRVSLPHLGTCYPETIFAASDAPDVKGNEVVSSRLDLAWHHHYTSLSDARRWYGDKWDPESDASTTKLFQKYDMYKEKAEKKFASAFMPSVGGLGGGTGGEKIPRSTEDEILQLAERASIDTSNDQFYDDRRAHEGRRSSQHGADLTSSLLTTKPSTCLAPIKELHATALSVPACDLSKTGARFDRTGRQRKKGSIPCDPCLQVLIQEEHHPGSAEQESLVSAPPCLKLREKLGRVLEQSEDRVDLLLEHYSSEQKPIDQFAVQMLLMQPFEVVAFEVAQKPHVLAQLLLVLKNWGDQASEQELQHGLGGGFRRVVRLTHKLAEIGKVVAAKGSARADPHDDGTDLYDGSLAVLYQLLVNPHLYEQLHGGIWDGNRLAYPHDYTAFRFFPRRFSLIVIQLHSPCHITSL